MTELSARIDSLESALAAVAEVAPIAREYAQKSEQSRTLAPEVVDAFARAGLWGAFAPPEVGGGGLGSLRDQYEVIRAMSYEDGSSGWVLFICGVGAMLMAARLPPEGCDQVFADGVPPIADVFMPSGQGRPADGGLLVSGRWQFASGIAHSPWVMANVISVDEEGAPIPSASGLPFEVVSLVVPADEVALIDDWNVAGLRGTGSMSFAMDSAFVPHARTFSFFGRARIDNRPYRIPLFTVVGPPFAAIAVGLAQRMLDEIVKVLPTKARPPTFQPPSESAATQGVVGRAIAEIRAADESTRAILARIDDVIASMDDPAELPITERTELHQHVTWVMERCAQVVGDLFRLGGASAIYDGGILERCWRDINVAAQHVYVSPQFHEYAAQLAFGMEVASPNI